MTIKLKSVFLYREDALSKVKKRLNALRVGESVVKPVLFFHGPSGIGKSTLLRQIKEASVEQLLPTALIDFEDEATREMADIADLPKNIMAQWQSTGRQLPPTKYMAPDDDVEPATEKLLTYARKLHSGTWPTPVVVLIDTLERANEEASIWIQKEFLPHLLEGKKTFVALASRYEPNVLDHPLGYTVNKEMKIIPLSPFSVLQSQEHLEKLRQINNAPESKWIQVVSANPIPLTGGLPGYNEQLVLYPFNNDREARKHLVENVVFKTIATGNLHEVRDEIMCIAAFRHCDNGTLAEVVHHFWPEKHPIASPRTGIRLARALRATTLVERHPDGYGVVVSPALRQLIDDYARDENLSRHFETHIMGYRLAERYIRDGEFDALLNLIYHLGGLWQDWKLAQMEHLDFPDDVPAPDERAQTLLETIQNNLHILQQHTNHARNQIEKALSTLEKEHNDFMRYFSTEEAQAIRNELQKALETALNGELPGGNEG